MFTLILFVALYGYQSTNQATLANINYFIKIRLINETFQYSVEHNNMLHNNQISLVTRGSA
jgi:hypothetical protein